MGKVWSSWPDPSLSEEGYPSTLARSTRFTCHRGPDLDTGLCSQGPCTSPTQTARVPVCVPTSSSEPVIQVSTRTWDTVNPVFPSQTTHRPCRRRIRTKISVCMSRNRPRTRTSTRTCRYHPWIRSPVYLCTYHRAHPWSWSRVLTRTTIHG